MLPYEREGTMDLNEFDKNPDETSRKKFVTPKRVGLLAAAVVMSILAMIFWPNSDEPKESSYDSPNVGLFYDPSEDSQFSPPEVPQPPTNDLICSIHMDACATPANFDSEIARMTAELEDRGLPVGSEDVVVRDAQMSHLITDLCYKPTESTFVAAERLWVDIWVNTPQTNRKMDLGIAASAVCSKEMSRLFYDYATPKDPYSDPSFGGNNLPDHYTPPVPPMEAPAVVEPPTTELAPAGHSDRDYN